VNAKRLGGVFLPTLLARLIEHPDGAPGPASRAAYEEAVLRDLRWLLNSTAVLSEDALEPNPWVRTSVLNFGIRSNYGSALSGDRIRTMASEIKTAILAFEPRVLRDSVSVSPESEIEDGRSAQVTFKINATYWYEPYPIELSMWARWDIDCGLLALDTER